MEPTANRQFIELERTHFWFIGRRAIFGHLLDRELAGRTGLRLLDVGCGAGGMYDLLARYGSVVGVDSSDELTSICRSRGYADVLVASATALPVADGAFDAVTLFDVIEHIPDDVGALGEARRVLRSGGLLAVSVPAYQFLYANNDRIAHHQRRYTARRLRARLEAAGFEPLQVTYFNTLLFPAILPAVLAGKVRERFVPPGDHTNLSVSIPPTLNRALGATMSSERHVLRRRSFPFGHSIFALARPA